jgi:hypothetical protein
VVDFSRSPARADFDLAMPLRLRADGTLSGWDALSHSNNRKFGWVSNAATCWQDASTARLVHLDLAPDLPVGAIQDLVRAAVCEAGDHGAMAVVSDVPVPHGEVLGFRRDGEGAMRVDTDLLVQDLGAATASGETSRALSLGGPAPGRARTVARHAPSVRKLGRSVEAQGAHGSVVECTASGHETPPTAQGSKLRPASSERSHRRVLGRHPDTHRVHDVIRTPTEADGLESRPRERS